VRCVHMAADSMSVEGLRECVSSVAPDIVGITMNTFQTKSAREISAVVKAVSKAILVVTGGPHPSALRNRIFNDFPKIDVVVVGEGERTFLEIAEGKSLCTIKGICYQGVENEPRPPADDLDHIPLPDLDDIDLNRFCGTDPVLAHPDMFIMGSRGCPNKCTFCNRSIWGEAKMRFRKPAAVIEEVKWLHERYKVREIFFQDDTFNLNRRWLEEVLHGLIENGLNRRIAFKAQFRVNENLIDESLLRLAKQAGFWLIFYGVESGNQQMLDRMRKGTTVDEVKRAFKLTHQAGMKTLGSFLVGMPGETRETIADSIELWKEIRPFVTGCNLPVPFPGTDLDREVTEQGHKLIEDYDEYWPEGQFVRTEPLEARELKEQFDKFRKLIIWRFILDLLKLRYWKMMLFSVTKPSYIRHIVRRVKNYLSIR
jgi:anaerobic magnesium-protoporphyrin IX monomethyl ester cyclase